MGDGAGGVNNVLGVNIPCGGVDNSQIIIIIIIINIRFYTAPTIQEELARYTAV